MAAEIRIKLNKSDQARADRALAELAAKARNPSGGLKNVGEALLQVTKNRFADQQDPHGRPWQALKPFTIMLRGAAGPILNRRGGLLRSITYRVGGSTLRLGPNTIYAAAQQFGTVITPKKGRFLAIPVAAGRGGRNQAGVVFARKVKLPPRPYIGFGSKDEEAARKAVEEWLEVEKEG